MDFFSSVDIFNYNGSDVSEVPSTSQKCGDLQACKVCLRTNIEDDVFLLEKFGLSQKFEQVTGISVSPEDGTPQHICKPCGLELQMFAAFRERCQQADVFIQEILREVPVLTTAHIQSLDRKKYQVPIVITDILSQPQANIQTVNEIDIKEESKPDPITLDSPSRYSDEDVDSKPLDVEMDNTNEIKSEDSTKCKIKLIKKTTNKRKKETKAKPKKKKRYNQKLEEDYEEFGKLYNFDVIFLNQEQQRNEILTRKETDEYKSSRFRCEQCYRAFMKESAYKKHMQCHDSSSGDHMCDICFARFIDKPKLSKHQRRHTSQFVCKICSNVSKDATMAKTHFQWHEGHKYVCKYCKKNFTVNSTYSNHIRENHTPVTCKLCGEVTDGTKGLSRHNKDRHGCHPCESCNTQFHTSEALSRHLSVIQEQSCNSLNSCLQCGEGFNSLEQLNEHNEMAHSGVVCELCNGTYKSDKQLAFHWGRAHKGVPRNVRKKPTAKTSQNRKMCEICAKSYPNETALRYHQRTHTGEKPFQCTMCDKTFRLKGNLQIHLSTHTGARPFKCALCPEVFKYPSQKYKHKLMVHTKERPHKCHMCAKTYVVKCDLTSHIRAVHMKLPYPPRNRRRDRRAYEAALPAPE